MTGGLSFEQILTIAEADYRNAGEIDRQAAAARTLADRLVSVRERLSGNDTGTGDETGDLGGFFADALSGTVDGLVAHLDDSARVIRPQADALHDVAETARTTREALRRIESERDGGDRAADDEARSVLAKAGSSYWGAVARLETPNSYDGPREREPGGEFRQSDAEAGGGPGGRTTTGIPLPDVGASGPASSATAPALQSGGPGPVTAAATGPAGTGPVTPGPGPVTAPFVPAKPIAAPPAAGPNQTRPVTARSTGTPHPFGTRSAGSPQPFGGRAATGATQLPARALPRPPGPTTAPVLGRRGTQQSTAANRGTQTLGTGTRRYAADGGGTAPRTGTRSPNGTGGNRTPVVGGRTSATDPRAARGATPPSTQGRAVRPSAIGGRTGAVTPSVIGGRAQRGPGVRTPARFGGDSAVNRAVIAGAKSRAAATPPASTTGPQQRGGTAATAGPRPSRNGPATTDGDRDHVWTVDAATVPAVIGGRRAEPSTMAFDPGEYLTRHNLGQSRVTAWGEPAPAETDDQR